MVSKVNVGRFRQAERTMWSSFGLEPVEHWLRLDRSRADVRVLEVGEGPAVVFVHGASNGATSWVSLVARLPGFRCLLLDRPGCGLSPRLGEPLHDMASLDAFGDDLVVDVLEAMILEGAHVVGTSFGGFFALRSAAAHPARVRRVVTLGWSFGSPVAATPLVMRIAMQPMLGRLALRIPASERMARSLLRQIGLRGALESGRFGPNEMQWFLSLLRDTPTMRNEIEAIPRLVTLRGFNQETLLDPSVLASIEAPALFLWGSDDPMGGETTAQAFADQVPNGTLEMINTAGHAPWIDHPDLVAERIRLFLHAAD